MCPRFHGRKGLFFGRCEALRQEAGHRAVPAVVRRLGRARKAAVVMPFRAAILARRAAFLGARRTALFARCFRTLGSLLALRFFLARFLVAPAAAATLATRL